MSDSPRVVWTAEDREEPELTASAGSDASRPAAGPDGVRLAYKLGEVSEMLGKSTKALMRLHAQGEMPGKRLGRTLMVPVAWVASYGEWQPSAARKDVA
jgi:hypothetical protein